MFPFDGYGQHLQYCGSLRAYIGQVLQEIEQEGSTEPPLVQSWRSELINLDHDVYRLQSASQAGFFNPMAFMQLFDKADQLFGRLHQFLSEALPEMAMKEADRAMEAQARVPIGGHQLPPLPYAYSALEPHIDEQTMRLHHEKHHQSYVDGLNKAERMMAQARETGNFDLLRHWEREAAFNGAGHYLHTIFWNVMSPNGGGEPTGALAEQIQQDFGSLEAFRKHFTHAAEKVEAVGWALLVWAPRSHRLEILQAEKHQNLSQWDVIPLLVLDVWEHAYYLKYQNKRSEYVDAWWNVVDWDSVAKRFEKAKMLTWEPY
jgi:superoxide dismutase